MHGRKWFLLQWTEEGRSAYNNQEHPISYFSGYRLLIRRNGIIMITYQVGLHQKSKSAAFTLVELLVVIGIIAVLMAILLPTLRRSRDAARRVECAANMRTLAMAYIQYAGENRYGLPIADVSAAGAWVKDNNTDNSTAPLKASLLMKFLNSDIKVFHCAADYSNHLRSYSVNSYLNCVQSAKNLWKIPAIDRLDSAQNAAKVVLMVEEFDPRTTTNQNSFVIKTGGLATPSNSWVDVPAHFHFTGCNVSFLDGHAEYWKYYSTATDKLPRPNQPAGTAGVGDLRRFQDAAGYK